MSGDREKWMRVSEQLELKRHELNLVQKRLQQTSHHQLQEEIKHLRNTVGKLYSIQEMQCFLTKLSLEFCFKLDIKFGNFVVLNVSL